MNPQARANDSASNGDLNQLLQYLQETPGTQGADAPKIRTGVSCLTGKPVQMMNSSAGEFVPDPNPCDAKALFERYVPVLGMASEIEKMEGISPEQKKKLFEQKFNESFAKENGFNAAVLSALPDFIKEQEQQQIDDAIRDRVFTKLKNYAPWANYFESIEKGDQAGLCFLAADRAREEKDPQLKEALQTTARNLRDLVQVRSPNGVPPIIGIAFGSGDLGGYGIARGIPAKYQRTIIDGYGRNFRVVQSNESSGLYQQRSPRWKIHHGLVRRSGKKQKRPR